MNRFPRWKAFTAGFAAFGQAMGALTNAVLLSVIYFLALGPSALLRRWIGDRKKPTGPSPKPGHAWQKRDPLSGDWSRWKRPY